MNNQRRKELAAIRAEVQNFSLLVDQLRERIEAIRDEEQDAFNNLPETFQEGERGERMQAAIDAMDSAIGDLEAVDFDAVTTGLEEAGE